MKTRTKILTVTTVLTAITLATLAGSAGAQRKGRGNDGPGCDGRGRAMLEERFEMMAEKLELTTEQQAQIEKIREEAAPVRGELRKQAMRLHNQLRGELLEDVPDKSAALQVVVQLGDVKTKLHLNRLEQRLAIREVLTPEQRDKLLGMGFGFGHGKGSGHGERGGRGMRGGQGKQCGHGLQQGNGSCRHW